MAVNIPKSLGVVEIFCFKLYSKFVCFVKWIFYTCNVKRDLRNELL